MLSCRNLASYCLTAAILGCLGISGVVSGESSAIAQTNADDETSHRGSGRIMTWHPPTVPQAAIAYRGTGRVHSESQDWQVSHRGSGRIENQSPDTQTVSYRGSGRIAPNSMPPSEFG